MADWRVGAQRDLSFDDSADWDAAAATTRILEWSASESGKIDARLARMGFLFYDAQAADLKNSYRLPFCDVVGGELKACTAGLKAAAAGLVKIETMPSAVTTRAQGVIDEYFADLRELDRIRQEIERAPMTQEQLEREMYERGLDAAIFWRQKTACGPLITVLPVGMLPPEQLADGKFPIDDPPSCEELWRVAALAVDAALTIDGESYKNGAGQQMFIFAFQKLGWPVWERQLRRTIEIGESGQLFRAWLDAEGERRAAERMWSTRENARRDGLHMARVVIRDLVRGLTLDDPTARAMIVAQHHRDLQDVLTT
jgi:hypothetical protein